MLFEKLKGFRYVCGCLDEILSSRQKRLGLIVFLMSVMDAFLQMLGVSIIVPLVSFMTNPEGLMNDAIVRKICSYAHIYTTEKLFIVLCVGTIVLYVVKNAFSLFQFWASSKYSNLVERELAFQVMNCYMHRTYDFFLRHDSAKILRDAEQDPQAIHGFIKSVFNILNELLTVTMIVIYIVQADWKMALCIGVIAVICLLVIYIFFKNPLKRMGVVRREAWAVHQRVFQEAIGGIKEVQVMRKQEAFLHRYQETYVAKQIPNLACTMAATSPTYIIEGMFVGGLMLYLCLSSVIDPSFSAKVPLLASFAMGAIRMLPALGRISSNLNTISYSTPSVISMADNLRSITEDEKRILLRRKEANNKGNSNKTCVYNAEKFEEALNLSGICWHYEGTDKQILRDLDLVIHKGESIGLIGQTGAGKSTLADVILGLHIPQSGQVLLDGHDIFSMADAYARVIGYVPQSIYLVDGSIKENVAFGEDLSNVNDEEIWSALEQAQLAGFVRTLEDGLDTVIGERGVRFSGGQRQRLAIARALYRKPQILVLDEATSALDNETEAAVMDAIEHLYGTITMIIIAHRLTTVAKCDAVYEIKEGKAVRTIL